MARQNCECTLSSLSLPLKYRSMTADLDGVRAAHSRRQHLQLPSAIRPGYAGHVCLRSRPEPCRRDPTSPRWCFSYRAVAGLSQTRRPTNLCKLLLNDVLEIMIPRNSLILLVAVGFLLSLSCVASGQSHPEPTLKPLPFVSTILATTWCCFSISTFGPLQKFSLTFAASGAFTRISTLRALSTRGYAAPQTLVSAGRNSGLRAPRNIRKPGQKKVPIANCLHWTLLVNVYGLHRAGS
jgi:hypothetical protein